MGTPGYIATTLPNLQPLTCPYQAEQHGPGILRSMLSLSCAGEVFFCGYRHSEETANKVMRGKKLWLLSGEGVKRLRSMGLKPQERG